MGFLEQAEKNAVACADAGLERTVVALKLLAGPPGGLAERQSALLAPLGMAEQQ